MGASYVPYPDYKDSGVEWLDDIPTTWGVAPIKRLSKIYNGATPKSGEVMFWDGDISWITPADLGKGVTPYIGQGSRSITTEGYESCGTSLVPKNTIILSSRAPIGTLGIADKELCTNQGCKSLVVKEDIVPKYIYYVLLSSTEQLNLLGRGTTFLELSSDELGFYKIGLPSEDEQEKIAKFLDHETAKIDTLIEKQQQLIKLLKEKRQAVISHAVTKDLNPNAPMRDSGVEWLGEVPEQWRVLKVGHCAFVTKLTGFEYTNLWEIDEAGEVIALRGFNVKERKLKLNDIERITTELSEKLVRSKLAKGDIVFPCTGTIGNAAMIQEDDKFHINQNIAKIRFDETVSSRFAIYWLTSSFIRTLIDRNNTSGMQPVVLIGDIRKLPIPRFKFQEQEAVSDYLDSIDEKFSILIEHANTAVQLLQERRTALISAAVTGKIDVRNWKAA